MKIAKNPFCIICSIIIVVLHTTFALPTPSENQNSKTSETTTAPTSTVLTPSTPTSEDASTKSTTSQAEGRNLRFVNNYEDVVLLAPIQDHLDSPDPYRKQVVGFEQPISPYALGYEDAVDVVPTPYEASLVDTRNHPAVVYPIDRIHDSDMSTAESNIVFRPLFSYRRQTAQKRRVYSPSTSSSSSSVNGQRRRVYSRYPVYYPSYPSYYYNAQYDYVP